MISPGTHPKSAPEAEKVIVNQDPGAWGLFVFPSIELPPPGAAFTDTWGALPMGLLDVLGRHGQDGTWWFAKVPPEEGSTGEPRYLTITYQGAGQYGAPPHPLLGAPPVHPRLRQRAASSGQRRLMFDGLRHSRPSAT